jgi:hypothetical protein
MKDVFPTPCSDWREKLAATHPDDLTPVAYRLLQAHIASCALCSAISADYEIIGTAISQLPGVDPIPEPSPALLKLLNASAYHADNTLVSSNNTSLVPIHRSAPFHSIGQMPMRQMSAAISTLAAALVVVALLGSFLLLFASQHTGTVHSGSKEAWQIIPSANPGSASNALLGIAALSENDTWAVGYTSNTTADVASQTLIEHWNGTQWSVVTSPHSVMSVNILNDVIALSTDDVWAVGFSLATPQSDGQQLIEHWDGIQWSIVNIPDVAQQLKGRSTILSRLVALSANNIWGIGTSTDRTGHSMTLTEQWTGTTWKIVPSPNPGSMINALHGAVAISANDIWAVGYFANSKSNLTGQTLIEHWDGRQWSIVSSPKVGAPSAVLHAATALSTNDVWAIGISTGENAYGQSLIEHWDGRQWRIVTSPNVATEEIFDSITSITANNIWATGVSINHTKTGNSESLLLHWDGRQWHIVSSPNRGGTTLLADIEKIPGSSSVWATGYYQDSNGKTFTWTLLYR